MKGDTGISVSGPALGIVGGPPPGRQTPGGHQSNSSTSVAGSTAGGVQKPTVSPPQGTPFNVTDGQNIALRSEENLDGSLAVHDKRRVSISVPNTTSAHDDNSRNDHHSVMPVDNATQTSSDVQSSSLLKSSTEAPSDAVRRKSAPSAAIKFVAAAEGQVKRRMFSSTAGPPGREKKKKSAIAATQMGFTQSMNLLGYKIPAADVWEMMTLRTGVQRVASDWMNTTWGTLFDLTSGNRSDLAISLVVSLLGREKKNDKVSLDGAQLFVKTRFRYHGRDVAQCLWTTVGDGPGQTHAPLANRTALEMQPIQLERWPKSLDWTGHFDEYTFQFMLLPKENMKKADVPNWRHRLQNSLRSLRIGWEFRTAWQHEGRSSSDYSKHNISKRGMSSGGIAQMHLKKFQGETVAIEPVWQHPLQSMLDVLQGVSDGIHDESIEMELARDYWDPTLHHEITHPLAEDYSGLPVVPLSIWWPASDLRYFLSHLGNKSAHHPKLEDMAVSIAPQLQAFQYKEKSVLVRAIEMIREFRQDEEHSDLLERLCFMARHCKNLSRILRRHRLTQESGQQRAEITSETLAEIGMAIHFELEGWRDFKHIIQCDVELHRLLGPKADQDNGIDEGRFMTHFKLTGCWKAIMPINLVRDGKHGGGVVAAGWELRQMQAVEGTVSRRVWRVQDGADPLDWLRSLRQELDEDTVISLRGVRNVVLSVNGTVHELTRGNARVIMPSKTVSQTPDSGMTEEEISKMLWDCTMKQLHIWKEGAAIRTKMVSYRVTIHDQADAEALVNAMERQDGAIAPLGGSGDLMLTPRHRGDVTARLVGVPPKERSPGKFLAKLADADDATLRSLLPAHAVIDVQMSRLTQMPPPDDCTTEYYPQHLMIVGKIHGFHPTLRDCQKAITHLIGTSTKGARRALEHLLMGERAKGLTVFEALCRNGHQLKLNSRPHAAFRCDSCSREVPEYTPLRGPFPFYQCDHAKCRRVVRRMAAMPGDIDRFIEHGSEQAEFESIPVRMCPPCHARHVDFKQHLWEVLHEPDLEFLLDDQGGQRAGQKKVAENDWLHMEVKSRVWRVFKSHFAWGESHTSEVVRNEEGDSEADVIASKIREGNAAMEAFLRRYSCWEAMKNAYWLEMSQAEIVNEPLNGSIGVDSHGDIRIVIASASSEGRTHEVDDPDLAASGVFDEDEDGDGGAVDDASLRKGPHGRSKTNSKKLWKLFQRVSA